MSLGTHVFLDSYSTPGGTNFSWIYEEAKQYISALVLVDCQNFLRKEAPLTELDIFLTNEIPIVFVAIDPIQSLINEISTVVDDLPQHVKDLRQKIKGQLVQLLTLNQRWTRVLEKWDNDLIIVTLKSLLIDWFVFLLDSIVVPKFPKKIDLSILQNSDTYVPLIALRKRLMYLGHRKTCPIIAENARNSVNLVQSNEHDEPKGVVSLTHFSEWAKLHNFTAEEVTAFIDYSTKSIFSPLAVCMLFRMNYDPNGKEFMDMYLQLLTTNIAKHSSQNRENWDSIAKTVIKLAVEEDFFFGDNEDGKVDTCIIKLKIVSTFRSNNAIKIVSQVQQFLQSFNTKDLVTVDIVIDPNFIDKDPPKGDHCYLVIVEDEYITEQHSLLQKLQNCSGVILPIFLAESSVKHGGNLSDVRGIVVNTVDFTVSSKTFALESMGSQSISYWLSRLIPDLITEVRVRLWGKSFAKKLAEDSFDTKKLIFVSKFNDKGMICSSA